MAVIKYTDKAALLEHPFTDTNFLEQYHSFVYPGDELILYHKLTLPDDANVPAMANIKFVSAKVSLIAQKNNVFSEEFSKEFLSARLFELDSFVTSFNNTNAKNVPWGTDGYAPNMNLQQDRNWKLPSGDIRRQINFLTQHPTSSTWDYYFSFPVLFRWEYWLSLLAADNDFYDVTQPQNGQNQLWWHYFTAKWKLKSRLDLSVLINGVPTIIRSQLNLTPGTIDVLDYNSNADWTAKSIKTSDVGGTPSNAPCFVYGNKYTEVWGYFTKVASWAVDEQSNLSAVAWIEPFEGTGQNARTRGSSLYPVGSETVFAGLSTSLTDDSGLNITTDAGDYIVTDGNGNGAVLYFDPAHPMDVKVFALIDYNKLKTVYPGINKFTLYIRLYNSTTGGFLPAITAQGEELKQDAILISTQSPASDLCTKSEPQCPFNIDAFADASDADELKNDKADFLDYGDASIASIEFTLQKNTSSCGDGTWIDKAAISNNTYGKFFAFGKSHDFSGANFEDDYGKKYTGFLLEWRKVMADFGAGNYRMKIVRTDVFTNVTTYYDQRVFCLKAYNCSLIDGTVRIEMLNQGTRGTLDDNTATIDYAAGWNGQIRLKGIFYADKKPGYNEEYMQYGDADNNSQRPYIAELRPKYILDLKPIPGWMDRYLENYFLLADQKMVTDYNISNINPFVKFLVINDGGIESGRESFSNPLAWARISLAYGQNNLRKRNSQ